MPEPAHHCVCRVSVDCSDGCLVVSRLVDLPFAPFPGLVIEFGDDGEDEFVVGGVCYDPRRRVFRLHEHWTCPGDQRAAVAREYYSDGWSVVFSEPHP